MMALRLIHMLRELVEKRVALLLFLRLELVHATTFSNFIEKHVSARLGHLMLRLICFRIEAAASRLLLLVLGIIKVHILLFLGALFLSRAELLWRA